MTRKGVITYTDKNTHYSTVTDKRTKELEKVSNDYIIDVPENQHILKRYLLFI